MAKRSKKLKRSVGYFKKRDKLHPVSALPFQQSILQQARAFHQAGHFSQAEPLYTQIVSAEPNNPEALYYWGMLAYQTGRKVMAVELINRAISYRPDYVPAYNSLGIMLSDQGRLDEAVASFRLAVGLKPDYFEAYYNLGYALYDQGKLEDATTSFARAISLKPDNAIAHNTLGIVYRDQGRLAEAAASFRLAIKLQPDFAEGHYNLGNTLHDQGNLAGAVASFRRAVTLKPAYAEAHYNLGISFHDQGNLAEAGASFLQTIHLRPDFAEAYNNLGDVLVGQNKSEEAVGCFRKAIELKPEFAEAYNNLGNILSDQDKLDEALESFRQAVTLKPDFDEALYNLGLVLSQTGKTNDALDSFKKALSIRPDYAQAFIGLSTLVKFTEVDDTVRAMEELYNKKENMSDADRIDLGFVLGKVFEDIGDYEKSFAFIFEANRLKRKSYTYSIQKDLDLFERIKKIFSHDFFVSHQGAGCPDKTPIFIVGMPRSGTTLVEQILASHPFVFGAGERDVLEDVTRDVCPGVDSPQFPECILDMSREALAQMGEAYRDKIRQFSDEAQHITDKLPHNFLRVGLIKAILPNAKVIHCRRDPMDTCFSIFKNDFKTGGHRYAYDLEELGRYYNLYSDLMAYWGKTLPGFLYTLRYEELVADQRHQTKMLLDFCDLPWSEACMSFYKTERKVRTASLAQVRRPLYQDSIALWKHHENNLTPLIRAIRTAGDVKTAAAGALQAAK